MSMAPIAEPLAPPVVCPSAPLASEPVAAEPRPENVPLLDGFWRSYEALPSKFGYASAATIPSWARDSASRMVATCTSRFSVATWSSSVVSWSSWNRVHQFGSIGSATGVLATGLGGWLNQVSGDAQPGDLKSGPMVQPHSSRTAAARTGLCIARFRGRRDGAARSILAEVAAG